MRHRLMIAVAVMLVLAVAASAGTIPTGTQVSVRLNRELKSGSDTVGSTFDGVLENAIKVNGKTVAPRGATVTGKVTAAKDSGRLHKPGYLTIRLTSINGIAVTTSPVSREGKSHTKSNVVKIGGGTAAGALIGGLAGGGKGAAIGAGAGAAAGTGLAAATGKQQAVFPAEEMLSFTVTSSSSMSVRTR